MKFKELEARLSDWHQRKYGTVVVNLEKTINKLAEECGEAIKALNKKQFGEAGAELADTVFVLFHLARYLGVDLEVECEKKLRIIEKRLEK